MGQLLKINTAFRRWFFVKGYNSTSAVSLGSGLSLVPDGLTGLTITVTIAKNGASAFSNPNAGALTLTEVAGGWYYGDFGTADADTAGPLKYLLSWDGNTEGDQDQVVTDLPGSTDWTADERTALRTILGVPASGTTPDVPSAGALKVIDDYIDTEVAAIKAKTDSLPSDPADASDIASAFSTVNATLATLTTYVDTEVAAIKAKTDNLPANPAAVGSAMTLADDAITTASIADNALTDAKIAVPAQTAGVPSRVLAMCRRSWEWTTRRRVRNRDTGQVQLFGANGTTVLETQTQTTVGSVDTISTGA